MKMISPFNIRGRCKDANGNYIEKGRWYFHDFWGYVRFVSEEKSENSLRSYCWKAERCFDEDKTGILVLSKFETSKCIRVDEKAMAKFCLRNAQWASKRLEELASDPAETSK